MPLPELPRGAAPLVSFAPLLRANGFPVAPDQTENFVAAVGLLGPRSMADIHAAARATLAPTPERFDDFDALFDAHFRGRTLAAPAPGDDETQMVEPEDGAQTLIEPEEANESGAEATGVEALTVREFQRMDDPAALLRFRRAAPAHLPTRRSRRHRPHHTGARPDLRRALRAAVRRDGEILDLPRLAPRHAHRRILLLIDVSGSMKSETDRAMRFAHALTQAAQRVEVFTLGTRLTRITQPMRRRSRTAALAAAAGVVADWDGGTRLGEALAAFLSVPRYAGFARSAFVIVLSDGLERGDPSALIGATDRLSRLAWRILWLSPLAADPNYAPQTEAMTAIAPMLRRIGDGSSTAAVAQEVLGFASLP